MDLETLAIAKAYTDSHGGGGTNDYNQLRNKPTINGKPLNGDTSLDDLDVQEKGDYADAPLSNTDIEELLNNFS